MPRGITLADGPHMLEAPKVTQLIQLQRLGYELTSVFGAALIKGTGKLDKDGQEIVEPDLGAIADHLYLLLSASEPHAGWTVERVSDALTLEAVSVAYQVLNELGNEGFGEEAPKAP